jgi:hypothetical protein
MTADSHPLYRALTEVVGERETSRAFEPGVSVAGAHYGMPLSSQEVDGRVRTMGHKVIVMRWDQSRVH